MPPVFALICVPSNEQTEAGKLAKMIIGSINNK